MWRSYGDRRLSEDWRKFKKLEKLNIAVKDSSEKFEVMFNPESYSLKYRVKHSRMQGIQTSSKKAHYSYTKPEELSLKLIFDDTGVSEFSDLGLVKLFSQTRKITIYERVQEFLKTCVGMDGKKHKPNDLRIEWGDLVFECVTTSVDVNYSMFDRGGRPVRAELDTVFTGNIKDSKRTLMENTSSPDLTHMRVVNSGDTLPLMTKDIYGDCSLYLEIARVNGLDSPRRLKTGSVVKFPPLEEEVLK